MRDCRCRTRRRSERMPRSEETVGEQPSEEFPRDIETEIPVVVRRTTARSLSGRGADAVREVQLERMSTGALLDRERGLVRPWSIACARHDLTHHVDGRADPEAQSDADEEGVVV